MEDDLPDIRRFLTKYPQQVFVNRPKPSVIPPKQIDALDSDDLVRMEMNRKKKRKLDAK